MLEKKKRANNSNENRKIDKNKIYFKIDLIFLIIINDKCY